MCTSRDRKVLGGGFRPFQDPINWRPFHLRVQAELVALPPNPGAKSLRRTPGRTPAPGGFKAATSLTYSTDLLGHSGNRGNSTTWVPPAVSWFLAAPL